MKKYISIFFGSFVWFFALSLIGTVVIQLIGGTVYWLNDIPNPRPFSIMLSIKYGIPSAFIFGLYGVYRRWREPSELESYLDAQEDKDKIKQYVAEQKKDSSNTM